jgi:NodT family efflux transporter outer membrane factor (OMF) lipoprotein
MSMMNHLASYSNAKCKKVAISTVILASALLVLPSCCIPQLRCAKKAPPLPEDFNGETSWDNSAQLGWHEFFDDPLLSGLIYESLNGNQELQILSQDVWIASNEVLARRGEYLPFVTFGAGAGIDKASRFTRAGAVEDQLLAAPGKGFPEPLPDFLVATNVSWEIDIWKKLRNARDAAALRYFATREGRNYVVTRLVAEVAENYYELMALDNQLQALDKTIEIQEKSLEFSKARKEAARDTELAVQRFQAEVRKNQSEKLIIQQRIVEAENRINFLLGRFPQPVERSSANYIDLKLHALAVGVPAQLLQNRPDIRQAERELAASGLDVQVARARFFPSVNLSAGVGLQAFNTRYLLDTPESLIYRAGADLVAPLINKKAIQADYMTANSRQLQAVYEYQRTVLNAYIEVVNRLSKVNNYTASIEIKKQQLASLEASVDNATKLFQNARAEYMEVLFAQRDLMEAKMVLIETKQEQLAAIVYTYQALGGGGWLPNGLLMTEVAMDELPPVEEIPLGQPLEVVPQGDEAAPAADAPTAAKEEALPGAVPQPGGPNEPQAEPVAPDIPFPNEVPEGKDSRLRVLPPPSTMARSELPSVQ